MTLLMEFLLLADSNDGKHGEVAPSVLVEVSGKTNLKERLMTRSLRHAKLSDSIPIASALLGPVGLGAGAYYLSQEIQIHTRRC